MERSRLGDAYVLVDGGFQDQLGSEEGLDLSTDSLVEVLAAVEHRGQCSDDHVRLVGMSDGSNDL